MKMKKGKVYPSPPPLPQPSSSSHHLKEDNSLSVLKLLPATILVLVSVLSAEDREVLAYLITRGTTISSSSSVDSKKKNKSSKNHKPPVFDCECFDCYTSYWLRWDSSPNRELIHEIIEAFENHHLTSNIENPSASRNNKSKRVKKKEKSVEPVTQIQTDNHVVSPNNSPGRLSEAEVADGEIAVEEEATVILPAAAVNGSHKGLARKVLPDVLGLFNSNFWRLWNPNA